MSEGTRLRYLKVALVVIGIFFVIGLYAMITVWPSGWSWDPRQSEYEQMIGGIYATLGVFLIIASRNPLSHLSLIWFTIWSSVVHGAIMFVQAMVDGTERVNLIGDVPALFVIALILWLLLPERRSAE